MSYHRDRGQKSRPIELFLEVRVLKIYVDMRQVVGWLALAHYGISYYGLIRCKLVYFQIIARVSITSNENDKYRWLCMRERPPRQCVNPLFQDSRMIGSQ